MTNDSRPNTGVERRASRGQLVNPRDGGDAALLVAGPQRAAVAGRYGVDDELRSVSCDRTRSRGYDRGLVRMRMP